MQRERTIRVIVLSILSVAVIGLSIGYATLRTELNINATATKKAVTWLVQFQDLTGPTLVGSAQAESPAVLTATNITVDVSVTKPGDSAEYKFYVKNAGDIDAKLTSNPVITGLTEAAAKKVNVELTYADGSAITTANSDLLAGASKQLKLTVTFDPTATEADLEETELDLPISTTLFYEQK